MNEKLILENVSYSYQNKMAVESLSFELPLARGITVLLGQNGAGKSTTLNLIAGLLRPDSGKIKFIEKNPFEERKYLSGEIGYLSEKPQLYTELTVEEYLRFCMGIRKNVRGFWDIPELLHKLDLSERRHSVIRSLSKGMQQRVGLAQAIIHRPKLIILDEPTIGLDPTNVIQIREFLMELSQDSGILLSTHILSEAQLLGEHFLIMKGGRLVASGPQALLSQQLNIQSVFDLKLQDKENLNGLITKLENKFGVSTVQNKMGEGDLCDISIFSHDDQNIAPELIDFIREENFKLFAISKREFDLEDIFVAYNNNQNQELR